MNFDARALRLQFRQYGLRTSAELAQAAKVSQPTISRALTTLSGELVRVGGGRNQRYGMLQPIGESGSSWPLYLIGPDGNPEQLGTLHSVLEKGFWLERTSTKWNSFFTEEFPDDYFPDLPWFLDDYRPQGFLGRAFARKHAESLGLGPNPVDWGGQKVVEAMLRFGSDFHGAFVLGRDSLANALAARPLALDQGRRGEGYPSLAEKALNGELIGSSAGGEQPKFLVEVSHDGRARHLLVKFSPEFEEPSGQRWADLLFAEHIAGVVLAAHGYEVARSEIVDAGGRRFLEVERFDRTEVGGREPVISLRAIGAAVLGEFGVPWTETSRALEEGNWLTEDAANSLATMWHFGRLIANTDMHDGNASLIFTPSLPLRLAPVYDMLPMAYRPTTHSTPQGVIDSQLEIAASDGSSTARNLARIFWETLAHSSTVSAEFREIASQHAKVLG